MRFAARILVVKRAFGSYSSIHLLISICDGTVQNSTKLRFEFFPFSVAIEGFTKRGSFTFLRKFW